MGDIIYEKTISSFFVWYYNTCIFFGTLQYWLDPLKSVYKQLKGKTA